MRVLWVLLPLVLLLGGAFLVAFIIAASRGQFDDLESPESRLVLWDPTEFDLQQRNPTRKGK